MAKDQTVKLKIRAFYESHNTSVKQLYDRFDKYDISYKTIAYWIKNENWVKSKYNELQDAIDALIVDEVSSSIDKKVKTMVSKKVVLGEIEDKNRAEDYFINEVATELMFSCVSKHFLAKEMVSNLRIAKEFAVSSEHIGTNKTYHDMLTSTYQTIHGKQTNIGLINPTITDNKELENMSSEELLEFINNSN
jgi:hypothetical protein